MSTNPPVQWKEETLLVSFLTFPWPLDPPNIRHIRWSKALWHHGDSNAGGSHRWQPHVQHSMSTGPHVRPVPLLQLQGTSKRWSLSRDSRDGCLFLGCHRERDCYLGDPIPNHRAPNHQLTNTLPETNIAPRNRWLEYYFPIREAIFRCYVSFREGSWYIYFGACEKRL